MKQELNHISRNYVWTGNKIVVFSVNQTYIFKQLKPLTLFRFGSANKIKKNKKAIIARAL